MDVHLRPATSLDRDFLSEMLVEAVAWRPSERRPTLGEVIANPDFARYIVDWPRSGDAGVIAEATKPLGAPWFRQATPVGAAWYRCFTEADPGFGFVASHIPEVSIAVSSPWRGLGIGRRLLSGLLNQATEEGRRALSLSVEPDNSARHLYVSLGFVVVSRTAGSWTMVYEPPDSA